MSHVVTNPDGQFLGFTKGKWHNEYADGFKFASFDTAYNAAQFEKRPGLSVIRDYGMDTQNETDVEVYTETHEEGVI